MFPGMQTSLVSEDRRAKSLNVFFRKKALKVIDQTQGTKAKSVPREWDF